MKAPQYHLNCESVLNKQTLRALHDMSTNILHLVDAYVS